jgi:hypothetical protein
VTLTEFLLARIAEDEEVARDASPGGWSFPGIESVAGGTLYDATRRIADVVYEQPEDHDGRIVRHLLVPEADVNGAHIARHDPARVLAECEAKRRIVEWHENWPVLVRTEPKMETDPADIRGYTMRMTQQIQWQTEREYFRRFGEAPPSGPILRLLAAVYADHPDYREEWRP